MKRRILIVEDEAVTSVMLEKTLKELGYEVVGSAFDGNEAIALARDKKPDIILMDIRLQGEMDGIEAAKRIYKDFNIPSIYLTAHSDDNTVKRAVESGPFGYLIKPFKERELYSNIEMLAHKFKLYQTTTQKPSKPPEQEQNTDPQERSPGSTLKSGDYRLAILAIQSIPHPAIVFNSNGGVMFSNNASRIFFKSEQKKGSDLLSLQDLPDMFGRIWTIGQDKFKTGKGFAMNGSISIRGVNRRVRIDMIPVMDHGNLQFVSAILVPEQIGTGGGISSDMSSSLDDIERRLLEIRFLASPEETYRMRRISLSTTEVIKKVREMHGISSSGNGKETK